MYTNLVSVYNKCYRLPILKIIVITGVRRSGKAKLLELFKEYIINNVKNYNILDINYNSLDFENLKKYHQLNDYIEQRYKKGMNNFVLIDEVQMCEGFENTINSLHAEEKYDIYNWFQCLSIK